MAAGPVYPIVLKSLYRIVYLPHEMASLPVFVLHPAIGGYSL